jgi:hypothetical protein
MVMVGEIGKEEEDVEEFDSQFVGRGLLLLIGGVG